MHVYTKGSASRREDNAGWAMAVLAQPGTAHDYHWLGAAGDAVRVNDPMQARPQYTDSATAEAVAVLMAMLWIAQLPAELEEVHVHSDSLLVQQAAEGRAGWRAPRPLT